MHQKCHRHLQKVAFPLPITAKGRSLLWESSPLMWLEIMKSCDQKPITLHLELFFNAFVTHDKQFIAGHQHSTTTAMFFWCLRVLSHWFSSAVCYVLWLFLYYKRIWLTLQPSREDCVLRLFFSQCPNVYPVGLAFRGFSLFLFLATCSFVPCRVIYLSAFPEAVYK